MKVSCITISNNTIQSHEQNSIVNYLDTKLMEFGIKFSGVHSISSNFDSLSRVINALDEELLFVIGGDSSSFNYDIKSNIANIMQEDLIECDDISNALNLVCVKKQIDYSLLEKEIYIPNNSFPLIDEDSYLYGFLYKTTYGFIVFLPESQNIINKLYDSSLKDIITSVFSIIDTNTITLKTYGLTTKDIKEQLVGFIDNQHGIIYNVFSNNLDGTITINNVSNNVTIMQEYVADTLTRLKKYIYSTSNISIYKMATDILQLSKKSLCIAETITSGYFTNKLYNEQNTDSHIESRVYNNMSTVTSKYKLTPINLTEDNQTNIKLISDVTAKIFEEAGTDLLIGIFGEYQNENSKNIGYVSVCDEDGIHIYKSVISSNKGDMIDILSKAGAYHLIKKIKENSLLF